MNIGLGERRRTILLVDGDAHARAVLRPALETAGFSVGEAATDREGERTALRIHPDAVLAELALDAGDGGATIAERLRAAGDGTPCYIVSSAADALVGSIGLHEMGVAGVFLKPDDPGIVIQTLRSRLGADLARSGEHEVSLIESVVALVEDLRRLEEFIRVRMIRLRVGALSHAEPDALRFCFDAVVLGTVAEGARLEIEMVPGEGRCVACRLTMPLEQRFAACPSCGASVTQIVAGAELRLAEVEVE